MRVHGNCLIGLTAGLAAFGVAGCSNPLPSSVPSSSTQSATGVWSGTDTVTGDSLVAIINSSGQATFIRSDGVQFDGTVNVSGSNFGVSLDGYTNFNKTFSDSSTFGSGSLEGVVFTGSSLTGTLVFSTLGGTSILGNWALNYETFPTNASSTAAVAGNYTDIVTHAVLSITSSGVMSEQNTTTGCVLNGSISTTDSSVNVYQVSYTLEDCTGSYAVLNGVQLIGLAYPDTNVSPMQLVIAVAGSHALHQYGIVSNLNLN